MHYTIGTSIKNITKIQSESQGYNRSHYTMTKSRTTRPFGPQPLQPATADTKPARRNKKPKDLNR